MRRSGYPVGQLGLGVAIGCSEIPRLRQAPRVPEVGTFQMRAVEVGTLQMRAVEVGTF